MKRNFSWNGFDIVPLGGIRVRIIDEDYDSTTEIQTAFTDTRYNFNNNDMDDDSLITFYKILESLSYDQAKDSNWKRTGPFKKDLKKRVDKIRNPPLALPADDN